MRWVTVLINCLFSFTISPNIEPVYGKKKSGQIISSSRQENLTTHFATNMINIRMYYKRKYAIYEICYSRHLLLALVHCKLIHIGHNWQNTAGPDFRNLENLENCHIDRCHIASRNSLPPNPPIYWANVDWWWITTWKNLREASLFMRQEVGFMVNPGKVSRIY